MTFLVIGCGSIGQRHVRNLRSVGIDVIACDPNPARRDEVTKRYGIRVFESLDAAFDQRLDAAYVCSPSNTHVPIAMQAARRGLHLFIEKPLSHSLEGLEDLQREVENRGLVVLVGCNMLFLGTLVRVKQALDERRIGNVVSARGQVGYYLPYWHPHEDYRKRYSANSGLGGGVILDSIHEVGMIRWLLGEVAEIFCFCGKLSGLEIDTEDTAEMLLKMRAGQLVHFHFDYLQRSYRRSLELVGEDGVIVWDYIARIVEVYDREDYHRHMYRENINADLNQMYLDQMAHFLRCLERTEKPRSDLTSARRDLEIVLAAKRSASDRTIVTL
jgi:predicted dehydrogenase